MPPISAAPQVPPLSQLSYAQQAPLIAFEGRKVPFYFQSIESDYLRARNKAALIDLGFYDILRIKGETAMQFLDPFTPTRILDLNLGCVREILITDDEGGIIDICRLYRFDEFIFLLVTPGRIDAILDLMVDNVPDDLEIDHRNDAYTTCAIIGPECDKFLPRVMGDDWKEVAPGQFLVGNIFTATVIVANTRIFGEPAWLISPAIARLEMVMERIFAAAEDDLHPVGLSTFELLRMEAGTPYPGFEVRHGILPGDVGMMNLVDFNKKDFSGRQAIFEASEAATGSWLVGIKMHDDIIPRRQMAINSGDELIGYITSGGYSYGLGSGIALGLVERAYAVKGTAIELVRHGRTFRGEVVSRPFYTNPMSEGMHTNG